MAAGIGVVAVVLVAFDIFLYTSLHSRLTANLDSALDTRARLVRAEAARLPAEALAPRLRELGLRATVRTADGRVYHSEPASPTIEAGLPAPEQDADRYFAFRRVELPGGAVAVVSARRSGVDRSLSRLLLLEVVGTTAALAVAALLLLRVSRTAFRPLREIAAAAGRTASGRSGERLRPDRPHTELGRMAAAYDRMLDTLEGALSEARTAQQRSRELEEHSRGIVETANDAYVATDHDGTIVDWNPQAERTFGWRRDEVLGRKVAETIVPPELRGAHRAGIERFKETGQGKLIGQRVELSALHRAGHCFPIELSLWVTGTGADTILHGFLHDITRRRAGEEARSRLASIVEFSTDAIISQDLEGAIVTWNSGAERMYGYEEQEVIGRHVSLLVSPDRHEEASSLWARVRRGRVVSGHETVHRAKNGSLVDVSVTLSPVKDAAGELTGISTVARDMSEQRWLANTLDAALADLSEAWRQAREAEDVSRRFLADAAHQLRTPMASIRACAETLLRGPDEAERDRLLAHLARETSRAARHVSSLLRMARLDQGETVAATRCDLAALCRDEADRACDLSPNLEISVRVVNLVDDYPQLDPSAVREILGNLLDNARRHAERRIEIVVEQEGKTVVVRVADDGPGVPDELVERIFERFTTLDGKGGSGLGLPIARTLARSHGGDLTYEDRCFVVRLPVTVAASDDLAGSRK